MSIDDVHLDVIDELEGELGPDLRAARDATPLPMLGAALARVFDDGLPPVAAPAPAPARRHRTLRRVAVGATVAGFFTGGLGVAGALPAPVQRAVADVADVVGVQLPDPADDHADPSADTPVVVPPTTVGSTPPTSAVRPTPSSTVPPTTVAPVPAEGRGKARGKDVEKPAPAPKKTESESETEVAEPEVRLEQQGRGNGGRSDSPAEPVPSSGGKGNGYGKGAGKDLVEDLLDIIEEAAPKA